MSSSNRLHKILHHLDNPNPTDQLLSHNVSSDRKIIYRQYPAKPVSELGTLKNKTIFITGGSRGIGLAIALKCAKDGCNIVIAAKTATMHPKLPGTIYTAAKQIDDLGGKALPVVCDIRDEEAIKRYVNVFGDN